MIVHAGAVARYRPGGWHAALIFGDSGSGKTDLALRALLAGWRLVSDDYSAVWSSGGDLWAKPPATIAGRIEVRGLGIEAEQSLPLARVCLAVVCQAEPVERLPEPETLDVAGVAVPCIRLDPFQASAVAKLDRALSTRSLPEARLGTGGASAYLARSPGPRPSGRGARRS